MREMKMPTQAEIHMSVVQKLLEVKEIISGALRRGLGMPILMVFGVMLSLVDKKPTIRQLYQVAELGKAQGEATRAPTFMRLSVASGQPRIEGAGLDFRDEIM